MNLIRIRFYSQINNILLTTKIVPIMKSIKLIEPIYRVEFKNRKGENVAQSVFFRDKEDALQFAEDNRYVNSEAYICKYWLK